MQRVILFLSILLIACAIAGILLFMPKQKTAQSTIQTQNAQPTKISRTYVLAKTDIYAAVPISKEDIEFKTFEFDNEIPKQMDNFLSKDEFEQGIVYAANKQISAGEKISKSSIIDTESIEYSKLRLLPQNGNISFVFPLDERHYATLENVKPGAFVDIFFRYEIKNPKKDEGIAPKRRKDNEYRNYETANTTTLIPLFEKKRVLFKQKIKPEENQKGKEMQLEHNVGQIFIELSQNDAKKIYTIENLGNFFIFATQDGKSNVVSTEKILQKEFIKELRGGESAK